MEKTLKLNSTALERRLNSIRVYLNLYSKIGKELVNKAKGWYLDKYHQSRRKRKNKRKLIQKIQTQSYKA